MAELIVALDLPDAPAAVDLLDRLPESVPVKVGSVLFTRSGSGFVRGLVQHRHPVFLDLKWHDIPNTVAGAVRSAVDLGVEMVTVHALGGPAMVEAAVRAAEGALKVVAVTVLTSHSPADWSAATQAGTPDLGANVERLARLAVGAGADGVVCAAAELPLVRPVVGAGRLVVPGIRRADDQAGDHQRVATPEGAVAGGATHLVVGRPILEATDPARAWETFRQAAEG